MRQLEEMYPYLRTEETAPGPASTIGAPVEYLDIATVIKVSEAISGEIVLEKLIDTLMHTAIAQAGADRGVLILSRGDEPRIKAEATTGGDTVRVELRDAPVTASVLPETVFYYVLRTRESIILDDAATELAFAADPYIRRGQARSILCVPLINQTKLVGVLYLENNLAPRVFAPARIAVLKLVASQAAIALENTRLYRDLEEREAKIRRLVDANIIGIFIWDLEGRILEANDAFLRMVGYDCEDVASGRLRWTELTPAEWLDRDAQQWAPELKITGRLQSYEKEYFRKDSSRVPILIGAATFEEGGHQGVAFVLDLTERKRAEHALHEGEVKIRALFDANIIGIVIGDVQGQVIEANDAFLHLLGYDREDLASGRLHRARITPPEWRDRLARTRAELETFGMAQPFEKEYLRKDGSRVPVLIGAAVFQRDRVVGFVLDISERKRAEAEAHDSEQRYREVQMDLARANRIATMGELAASIAHEVNQPIAAARNNAASALRFFSRKPPDLDEVREALGCIVSDVDRAGDVIGGIRKLIQKAPAPRDDCLDINEAIREVIVLTRGEALKNGVSVEMQLAEGLPLIQGDRVQLQQVIVNLIVNAVEAMAGAGEGPRELAIVSGIDDANDVVVEVQDTGPGIDPAHLDPCSSPSTRPSPTALAWASQSAAPSSMRMEDGCGQMRMNLDHMSA